MQAPQAHSPAPKPRTGTQTSRREKKKRSDLLGNIKKHDKVLTIGGIVGTVVELKDDSLILKVDETSNTRITFTKSSISQVIPQDATA